MSVYPVKEFFQNKVIFSEGSKGDAAYILKKGVVAISIKAGDQKNELTRLRPPAVFGEMALLLKDHNRTATATALEHCEVVEISRQSFGDYIDRSPSVIGSILRALADRLMTTTMRALRTPDLFMGACEILHLIGHNSGGALPYEQAVEALSKAFLVGNRQIEGLFEMMSSANLVTSAQDPNGVRTISISGNDDFLERAHKIYKGLKDIE